MTKICDEEELTLRGFTIIRFKDDYQAQCSISESSSIEPRLWLGVDKAPPSASNVENPWGQMHLGPKQARWLAEILIEWCNLIEEERQ